MIVEFFLQMKKIPTTTHQQKKVAVLNGKVRYYEPESLAEARSKFMSALYPHAPADEMKGPIRLTVKWLFPMTKKSEDGQYKISKPDLDNLMKLIKDCMTDLAFWKDDAQVASLVTEKFYAKPPEVQVAQSSVEEVAPPTAEQLEQEKILQLVKKAGGSSVLLRTEKIGDNVKPLIVRHYARYTEIGTVDFWQEVVTIE